MVGSLILILVISGCVDTSSQEPIVGTWEHNDKDSYIWASIGADNQVRIYLYLKDQQRVGGDVVQTVKKIGPNRYKLYVGDIEGLNLTYLPERDVYYVGSNPEFLYYRTAAKQPMPPTPAL